MSWMSRALKVMTYLAGSSSSPAHTIGPVTAGASLSGTEKAEDLLCRLSFEDLGLRVCVDMFGRYVSEFGVDSKSDSEMWQRR